MVRVWVRVWVRVRVRVRVTALFSSLPQNEIQGGGVSIKLLGLDIPVQTSGWRVTSWSLAAAATALLITNDFLEPVRCSTVRTDM